MDDDLMLIPLGWCDIRDDLLNPLLIQYGQLDWSIIMHPNMFLIESKLYFQQDKNKKYISKIKRKK